MDQLFEAWKAFFEVLERFLVELQLGPDLDILEIGKQLLEF